MTEHPFWELLPELYADDSLLRGLVAVFEEQYLQNEQRIDSLPEELYDPRQSPEGFLNFLGELVGLRNENSLFLPAQMRALIPAAYRIQRKRGTRQALFELLSVYLESLCGHPAVPVILEYEDWQSAGMPPEAAFLCPRLYKTENDVVILLPPEPLLQSAEEQARLEQLARLYCPATADVQVVVLRCGEGWGYLGVNT